MLFLAHKFLAFFQAAGLTFDVGAGAVFNMDVGRCSKCKRTGSLEVDMTFLPSTTILCDKCQGERFRDTVLSVKYREKSINDILNMDVDEALLFSADIIIQSSSE